MVALPTRAELLMMNREAPSSNSMAKKTSSGRTPEEDAESGSIGRESHYIIKNSDRKVNLENSENYQKQENVSTTEVGEKEKKIPEGS